MASLIAHLKDHFFRIFGASASDGDEGVPPTLNSLPPCKHRLDNGTSNTVTLPDGRKLGYAQYGSLTGVPIFYLHGFPGSRIEASSLHDFGLELGVRFISTDRPGIGWSSPHPGRTLTDFAKDLEYLADHLELEPYSVLVRKSIHPSSHGRHTNAAKREYQAAALTLSHAPLPCPRTNSNAHPSSAVSAHPISV
jgi:hypothetical protein